MPEGTAAEAANEALETEERGEKAPREFSPITTQEEFDRRIKARIKRLEDKHDAELSALKGSLDAEKERADEAEAALHEKDAEAQAEAWRKEVSEASGVPADVLRGSTKEELEAHAEAMKPYFEKEAAPVVDAGEPSDDESGTTGDWLRDAIIGN